MPLFILAILTLMFLADAWWWWRADRLLRPVPRAGFWRLGLAGFMLTCIAGLALVVASRFSPPLRESIGAALIAGLFIWHFIVLPLVAIPSVLVALVGAVGRLVCRDPSPADETLVEAPPAPEGLTRRQLLGAMVAAAPPLVTIGGTVRGLDQLDEFRVRPITVPLAGLPADLDGLTIAHVSDVHVGGFTRGRTLDRIAEAVNGLKPDLVLQTGDLINHAIADLPDAIDMSRRMAGRYGFFLCEGNHDLIESRYEFERRMIASGLPLLINEARSVAIRGVAVQIMGLRWGWPAGVMPRTANPRDARRSPEEAIAASMRELLRHRQPDAFPILLAHHPHAFDVAAEAGIPLTLAGHTHGGQLHLSPGIGFGPLMYRYWSGLYRKTDDRSALVVSNGVGNWFPLRINAPAEIVHVTLRRA